MELKHKKIFSIFLFSITAFCLFAAKVPALQGRVNDYANLMSAKAKNETQAYLETLEKKTGVQLAVLTVKNMGGQSIEEFSIRVAEEWKLGQKGSDNGVLLVVAYNEHDVRIEVGYGLEGILTDALCGKIIRGVIIPQFKNDNYSEGILTGVKTIGRCITPEESEAAIQEIEEKESKTSELPFVVILFVFLFILFLTRGPRLWPFFIPYRTSGPVSRGGSSFGGGSFRGGGGHFGGGGASGHW